MYKLIVKEKQLLEDNKHIQATCDFVDEVTVLRKDIVVKSTVESFEQTALEVGETLAKSFECLKNIKKELPVDLVQIEKDREEQREKERVVAEEAQKQTEVTNIEYTSV